MTYGGDIYCHNNDTGAEKKVCYIGGYLFHNSGEWDTSAECSQHYGDYTLPSPYNSGSCDTDGNASCGWY